MSERRLYDLLPQLYRSRDARIDGRPLEALCAVLDRAAATVEENIDDLYRAWFVDTCDPWALPYLADLAGIETPPGGAFDPRMLVADAIAYARRKGSYPALEHRLSALSGWPVEVVYIPPKRIVTARYWPDPAFPLRDVAASADGEGRFRFHPLGVDCPLFAPPPARSGIETRFVAASDAPLPLAGSDDPLRGIAIVDGEGRRIARADMAVADLSEWRKPTGVAARALVDPSLGRFTLAEGGEGGVAVSFAYAAAGKIGGGPYLHGAPPRAAWLAYVDSDAVPTAPEDGPPFVFSRLGDALAAFARSRDDGLILILDSAACEIDGRLDADSLPCSADPNIPRRLAIEALGGETPVLRGTLRFAGGSAGLDLRLSGLWIDGGIELSGRVAARISDCTFHPAPARRSGFNRDQVPAAIRLEGDTVAGASLLLEACLSGAVALPPGFPLTVRDSVIDGKGGDAVAGGAFASLARTTVLGTSRFSTLNAVDTLFAAPLTVDDADAATASYCALVEPTAIGTMIQCRTTPVAWPIRSTAYGSPGYARLKADDGNTLRAAASNGSEIGVFNSDLAVLREQLMQAALAEDLPIGLDSAIEVR